MFKMRGKKPSQLFLFTVVAFEIDAADREQERKEKRLFDATKIFNKWKKNTEIRTIFSLAQHVSISSPTDLA